MQSGKSMITSSEEKDKPIRRGNRSITPDGLNVPVKPPVWKQLLFTVITIVALFVVVEMILALAGVRPVLYDEDPYVGFSSYIPLFVEQTGPDGKIAMVTAKNKLELFNPQRFVKNKLTGTYRIFCMGGSTTVGRPYDDTTSFCGWLRAMLPKADPSRQWEIINAGGVSYASYRIAKLMEELVHYEPDLFIIYSGHNEFLEQRTYGRIINTPGIVRSLGAIMSRTRSYAGARRVVDKVGGRSGRTVPRRSYLPGEVDTILENTHGPQEYHRDTEFQKQVLSHYRYNLTRMVDIARTVGAKVILVTPASNLRHCSPFKSEHRDGLNDADLKYWQTLFDHASATYAAAQWEETLITIDKAIALDDQYAHLHYLRGCVLWELKRYNEARTAFIRALDEDVCPLRILTPMLNIVIEVAEERNVPVVDFVGLLEQQSEHATPGESLFFDHVHPTIEGNRQLALALLKVMNKQGIVHFTSTWGDIETRRVTQNVEGRLDRKAHGIALRNLSRLFRWAGKFEEGYKLGLRAIQMAPADAEAHFQLGANAKELDRIDEAITHYHQALQIEPNYVDVHRALGVALHAQADALAEQDKLDEAINHYRQALQAEPNFTEAHNNLGSALAAQGRLNEAISHYRRALQIEPDYVHAHYNLGSLLLTMGKIDEAISHFRQALQIKPDYVHALCGLGIALQSQGKLDEAISHYRRALQIKPNFAEAHSNLGDAQIELGRLDQAISHYNQALQINPNDANVHCNLGIATWAKGELDQAVSHYRQALRIKPDHAEAHNNLANALVELGRLEEAINHYRQALRAKPNDAKVHHNLGRALVIAKQLDGALEHFREAVRLKPNWPAPLTGMARILAVHPDTNVRDASEAIRFAQRAAKLTKYQNASVLDTLATAYAAAGQFDRAVDTAQAAITLASAAQADELVSSLRKQLELYKQNKF